MVKYLLDTDHLVDLLRGENGVQERIAAEGLSACAVSAISLGELYTFACRTGMERHFRECEFIRKTFMVLPFSAALEYGKIRSALEVKGSRLDDMDILIAATALERNLTLITANERHFSRIPDLMVSSFRQIL